MKKILIAVLCSIIILGSGFTATAVIIPEELEVDQEIIDKYTTLEKDSNYTGYIFASLGPKKLSYIGLKIDNGTLFNRTWLGISFIETILVRMLLLSKAPLMRPTVLLVTDLDFTLTYKRDNLRGNLSRDLYFTTFNYLEEGNYTGDNTTIFNEKHTVKVEGFQGAIILTKRNFRLGSPKFMIFGGAENVTLVE